MHNPWDTRYSGEEYFYGTKPNTFFADFLSTFNKTGKILLPGEGEGRNAVFAASRGWQVDAFDSSEVARKKALKLAAENSVNISYQILDIENFTAGDASYDLVSLIFIHLPEWLRVRFHAEIIKVLKPGGKLFMAAFSKEQIAFNSGGPPDVELLYSSQILQKDFALLLPLQLCQQRVILNEGRHHGEADILIFVGEKLV